MECAIGWPKRYPWRSTFEVSGITVVGDIITFKRLGNLAGNHTQINKGQIKTECKDECKCLEVSRYSNKTHQICKRE
jgi:hypothetical protein